MQGKCSSSANWNEADGQGFLTPHVIILPFSHKKIKPHYQNVIFHGWRKRSYMAIMFH
jgi:hypothetical protein